MGCANAESELAAANEMVSYFCQMKFSAKPLMILGTASSTGKSLLTTALCRIFYQEGHRVCPFKAQNMSNNSFVTRDGREMGRAQVVQAIAAGLEPDVRMNPVLLKPSSFMGSQVVVDGQVAFDLQSKDWLKSRKLLRPAVQRAYESLAREYERIILEGAGSPAEVNLQSQDIVNMGMADMADAPVLIVGDIDRGGVFAAFLGTYLLIPEAQRHRIQGFVINKFRGDASLLKPAIDDLQARTQIPVLGVIPWLDHGIDEEDAANWGRSQQRIALEPGVPRVRVLLIMLPHISNFTDFEPLLDDPRFDVITVRTAQQWTEADWVILPGTKATQTDWLALQQSGLHQRLLDFVQQGGRVLGICGGFQMLGRRLLDPRGVEGPRQDLQTLGLLDMETEFAAEKKTVQVSVCWEEDQAEGQGYEIHQGISHFGPEAIPCSFSKHVDGHEAAWISGVRNAQGTVWGTYVHGLLDSVVLRERLFQLDPAQRPAQMQNRSEWLQKDLNRLADHVRAHLDMECINRLFEKS